MNFLRLYLQRRMLVILVLGFVSGLPLALSASTLSIWLTEEGISLATIGFLAVVGTPYAFKFLWSPLVDGIKLPGFCHLLGQRRGWLVATGIVLMAALVLMGMCIPQEDIWLIGIYALIVAAASATQDIIIDAYRVELLPEQQQGAGAGVAVLGYRLGMIMSAAGALFIATAFGWAFAYMMMAALIPLGWGAVLNGGEPSGQGQKSVSAGHGIFDWIQEHVIEPFSDFMQRDAWLAILLFILLYKLGDAFIGGMTNPFFISIGFTKNQIATVVKLYGVIATIVGSLIGGAMVAKIGVRKTLWVCGIGHGLTNLMFVAQAWVGADELFLAFSISLENISGGMGTAAFVAFISSLVNLRFTATQYALLSSFSAFGRTWLSAPAGRAAEILGWELFFAFSVVLTIPGLVVLWWLGRRRLLDTGN